ncbi:unnamed protein product [Ceutorhynchus assimilis]|uniref:Tetratricopeptide repeat domain 19 n=1 Tax=Ceutorhynchus assimilis TaxID=467358 RepID=A0A9N9MVW5_9CUCU|nr:unnamed protein product [Ceutorhynchus assimilis]
MFKLAQTVYKLTQRSNKIYPLAYSVIRHFDQKKVRLCNPVPLEPPKFTFWPVTLSLSILTWLGFTKDDEEKESELIMTLKRAVLCKQREEFQKAEQMLHLALRMAQQQQNQQGILYCYDLMANLAFDCLELDKAEKLFVVVLQMLLGNGTPQDDLKVIHISLKLARISQLQDKPDRAELGYKFCLKQIESHKNSEDAKILYGVINDWYAQLMLDTNNPSEAFIHLNEAYKACNETQGIYSEKSMLLLNDLAITSFRAEDSEKAVKFLKEAIEVGNQLTDKTHLGVVHANLGLILLHRGVIEEAEKACIQGRNLGKKHDNNESIEQANYCLDQIKMNLEK